MRRRRDRGGAQIDRACDAPGSGQFAEVRHFGVDPQRQRVRAVDILLDDWRPIIGEVPRQFELHARVVDRDRRGQNQRAAVALFPEAMDHRRHQAQHATRALELHQRRPVAVEPVEDFGVDRESGLDAPLVIACAAVWREFGRLRAVEIREGARRQVALLVEIARDRLEQAPPHDLETFLRRCRPP
jgi:hypothetical protein